MRTSWIKDGNCYGTDIDFFPAKGQNIDHLRVICSDCPVRRECAAFAIAGTESYPDIYDHGVWGGLSVSQRQEVRRGRADLDQILASS